MKKFLSVFLVTLFTVTAVFSQNKKDILLEVDGKTIYVDEFKRVYSKNLDLVQDESQRDIDGYLDLFIDYKLKIAEARVQGLDQGEEYVNEVEKYRNQLSRNYMSESKLASEMAREAYERGKEEIDASHILLMIGYEALPQDTLAAYQRMESIREEALAGADFAELVKKYSEEPGVDRTAGRLGYFSALNMVYPFETEAYQTEVGAISNIVRSSFGYHLIKVHDRRERLPMISVSHIMVSDKKGDRNFDPEARINEILTMYNQGTSFEDLAKEYSDDVATGQVGGQLKPFQKGALRSPAFENTAYALKTPGEVSQPVKSDFGWHIIRLDEVFERDSFETQQASLEKQMTSGDRGKRITASVNDDIKKKYGFKVKNDYLSFFTDYLSDEVLSRKWELAPIPANENKVIFTIGDRDVKYDEFASFIETRQKTVRVHQEKNRLLMNVYEEFENEVIKEYFKTQLEVENREYAAILNEYREGLLIFDVMEHNVWNKAKNDSVGIQQYYEKNKEHYRWNKRVSGSVLSSPSKEIAQQIQSMLKEGKDAETVKTELNTDGQVNVMVTSGVFEIGQPPLPEAADVTVGVSEIYTRNGSYFVVSAHEILPEGVKELSAVRGTIVSQYQNQVEREWVESLRSKYSVNVNQKTLKRLKKQLR